MFKLVGIAVFFMLFFKFGRRVGGGRGKETIHEIPKKVKKTFNEAREGFKRYYKEIITDENGRTKKQIRVIEEIDREEYLDLKDEV